METFLIIGMIAGLAILICGIMVTIPAPHTYAENVKVNEPTLALPHGLVINAVDNYPATYDLGTQEMPTDYRKELIKAVRDMLTGRFTSTLYLDYRDEEMEVGNTPLLEDEWRERHVNRVIDNNQLIFDFAEDNCLQPHDFHNVIDIKEGETE